MAGEEESLAQAVPHWPDTDAYRALIEQVIAGKGLSGLIRVLADMLGLPAAVGNEDFEPLHAYAPRGKHLTPGEAALPADVRGSLSFDLASQPQASTSPSTLTARSEAEVAYAVAPVVEGHAEILQEPVAYLPGKAKRQEYQIGC